MSATHASALKLNATSLAPYVLRSVPNGLREAFAALAADSFLTLLVKDQTDECSPADHAISLIHAIDCGLAKCVTTRLNTTAIFRSHRAVGRQLLHAFLSFAHRRQSPARARVSALDALTPPPTRRNGCKPHRTVSSTTMTARTTSLDTAADSYGEWNVR